MGVWRERWLQASPGVFRWAGVVMLVALPVFLVTLNVRVLFNMPWVYNAGFERNGIEESTGVPQAELERVGDEIREYFNNDEEYMFIFLDARPLFTAREVEHMRDVKALLGLVYTIMYVTGAAVALYAGVGLPSRGAALPAPRVDGRGGWRSRARGGGHRAGAGLPGLLHALSPDQLQQ